MILQLVFQGKEQRKKHIHAKLLSNSVLMKYSRPASELVIGQTPSVLPASCLVKPKLLFF